MCELFGYIGTKKRRLTGDLEEFFSHSKDHPDGWGIAKFDDEELDIEKEPLPAFKSKRLRNVLDNEIESSIMLAHIRLATIGYDEYENSHPFWGFDDSGRMWTLIHNGTIFEGDVLSPFLYCQKGSTDSERLFLYLLKKINEAIDKKGEPLDPAERFDVINDIVRELSPSNKLNLIIYDGEQMYVHSNCRNTLFMREDEDGITFSTNPLSKGMWKLHPFTMLAAYKDGKRVMIGESHDNEYIPDEKSIRALYLAYAGL